MSPLQITRHILHSRSAIAAALLLAAAGLWLVAADGPPKGPRDLAEPPRARTRESATDDGAAHIPQAAARGGAAVAAKPPAPLSTASHAYAAAIADLKADYSVWASLGGCPTVAAYDRPFIRYVWVDTYDLDDARAAILVINLAGRQRSVAVRPVPIVTHVGPRDGPPQDGSVMLLRVDLRQVAPQLRDLGEWTRFWEDLQNEPRASLLLTADTIRFNKKRWPGGKAPMKRRKVEKMVGGKPEMVDESVPVTDFADAALVRLQGDHVDPELVDELTTLTATQAPVVTHSYMIARMAATIKKDVNGNAAPLFNDLYGGRYYEFKGIRRASEVNSGRSLGKDAQAKSDAADAARGRKATDLDVLLDQLGVGNVAGKLSLDQLQDRLGAEYRALIWTSGVTGKWRRVRLFHGPASRDGTGRIGLTDDVRDTSIDLRNNPFFNALTFKPDAHELIADDGFFLCALFNGDGALQDEVPADIAADTTIPNPYTKRLQPIISCLRCHGGDGSDGWKPLRNDFARMLATYGDSYGDLSQDGKSQADQVNLLAGFYAYPQFLLDKNLHRARDDLADAVLLATGWPQPGGVDPKAKPQSVVRLAANRIGDIWARYYYRPVDADTALRELGLRPGPGGAAATFRDLMAGDLVPGAPAVPEDPRVAGIVASGASKAAPLGEGRGINRVDWDLAYGFVAYRAYRTLASRGQKAYNFTSKSKADMKSDIPRGNGGPGNAPKTSPGAVRPGNPGGAPARPATPR